MRICCAISGFSSMLSLTMRTAPLAARTIFSSTGPSCLQGPHQGAQKSTMTGWSNEASTTSAMKLAVVTSLTTAAPAAAPPPIKDSFAMRYFSPGTFCKTWRQADVMTSAASVARGLQIRTSTHRQFVEIDDARPVPAIGDKAQEIGRRNSSRAVVAQRVIVERVVRQHGLVEHHRDSTGRVVGERERGHAPRGDAEPLLQEFGAAEREARRAQRLRQALQVNASFLEGDDQPQFAFLVLEEQALAMPARQLAAR